MERLLSFTLKANEGKLFRVKFNINQKKIRDLQITGDFFVYPTDAIEIVENGLNGCLIDKEIINNLFEKITIKHNITIIGFTGKDLALAILSAKEWNDV